MVIDVSRELEMLPVNPHFVKRVTKIGRYRYEFVFTEAARKKQIFVYFIQLEEA
jgi:hypothetical protein